jgi:hypothetical protein
MTTFTIIGQGYRDTETGEPDDATSVTSGSEGGWGKRPAMDLARSLPTQVAERQLMDGIVRSTEDPDTRVRPPAAAQPSTSAQAWQAQRDAQRQWGEVQRQWYETQQRQGRQ